MDQKKLESAREYLLSGGEGFPDLQTKPPPEAVLRGRFFSLPYQSRKPGKYSSTKSTAPTVHSRPLRCSRHPAGVVKSKRSL